MCDQKAVLPVAGLGTRFYQQVSQFLRKWSQWLTVLQLNM